MTQSSPDPLVPVDCDLRGMPFMPLDTVRLLDSDLWALSTGDEFKAAVALWCKAWYQVPAASLPNEEKILSHLSGAKNWKKVREGAMRGWILCSDNRYYHPLLAEKALEVFPKRQEYEQKRANAAARKKREREERSTMFAFLRTKNIIPAWDINTSDLRALYAEHNKPEASGQQNQGVPAKVTQPVTSDQSQPDTAIKKSESKGTKNLNTSSGDPDVAEPTKAQAKAVLDHLNKATQSRYQPVTANIGPILARIAEFSYDDCIAVIDDRVKEWRTDSKMRKYLRPATIFNATNFAQYQGQLGQLSLDGEGRPDPRWGSAK